MSLSNRVHHFAVAVSDLEASVAWYSEKLELVVEKHFVLREAQVEIVKLISETGVRIELLKSLARDPVRSSGAVVDPGAKHLCFQVDDIEEAAAEVLRRGIRIVQEPKVIEASREKNCWIVDNEGNMIEFIEEY